MTFLLVATLTLVGAGCPARGSAARSIAAAGPVYAAAAAPGVIPAGTELVIRANEPIDTDHAVAGRVYSAQADRGVVDVRANIIVPAGSPAQLIVTNESSGGTFGTPQLELTVRSQTVDGRSYNVISDLSRQEADREGLGANRRTTETVGGAALLSTLLTKGGRVRVPPKPS